MASIQTIASQLIGSSDALTRQLSEDDRINSQNLISMQTFFIIGSVLVGITILYLMKGLLRPISLIIKATEEVKKGNLSIPPIAHCNRRDEIGILAGSFNSMIKQLAEYEQMQADFINTAAHELRTPIQPIVGLTEVMLSKTKDQTQRELLEIVARNSKRLKRLVENVLDITRIENQSLELHKERLNLNEIILSILGEYEGQNRNDNNVKIAFNAKDDFFVEADRERLIQVISNVMNNAVKFTQEGIIKVMINKKDKTNEIIITIKDTGSGIDPEIMPRLFSKFATKSQTGTGLGLFISQNIVEAHGGKIWGENNKDGKGATFTLTLPLIS